MYQKFKGNEDKMEHSTNNQFHTVENFTERHEE
jgi:hypothetical protein